MGNQFGRMTAAVADTSEALAPDISGVSLAESGARFLFFWIIPVVLGAAVSFAPPILNDGDTFGHIAAGRWMIAHGAVPATDPFSDTSGGRPWMAHEWLSEVGMGAAYLAAGWSGVMLLTGLAAAALAAVMSRWLLRWLSPLSAIASLAVGAACVAPGALARPHFLALPVLAFWTIALMQSRERGRAPPPALALVLALWANLHSSFLVGLIIAAAFGVEALLDFRVWRWRAAGGWIAFLALSAAATLATPHGVDGLTFPLKVLGMKTLPFIIEWQGPDFLKPTTLELAFLAGLLVAFWRGVRLTAVRTLILVGLLHMSLQHVRQEVLLGVVGPLILAAPLGRALGRTEPKPLTRHLPAPQAALAALLVLVWCVARLAIPEVRVDGPTAPISALAHVPPALRAQPVLNYYDFGGYLIFQGVRPYVDGRADMYGDAFMTDYEHIQNGGQSAMERAIDRYRIGWAIVPPNVPLATVLARTPGWKRTYADKYAVVLLRQAS